MKELSLISLTLKNFKGIKDLAIPINGGPTNIFGANATGKTTINDAFRWLLFDKDSSDRSDFEIKTLDKSGNVIHGLEHTVIAKLGISGVTETLQKTYKELWRKRRGDVDSTFTGHETTYSINDVPMKKLDFQKEITSIIDEQTFKMITDPYYFSLGIHWQDRRELVMKITGDIEDTHVVNSKPELSNLNLEGKSIEDFRLSVAAKRKKLNAELKSIPTRIDECNNSINREYNFDEIKLELLECQRELEEVEGIISTPPAVNPDVEKKRERIKEISQEIFNLENLHNESHREECQKFLDAVNRKSDHASDEKRKIMQVQSVKSNIQTDLLTIRNNIKCLQDKWDQEKAKEFTFNEAAECPTCKRGFPKEDIENKKSHLLETFNTNKAKTLNEITKKGKAETEKLKRTEEELQQANDDLKLFETALQTYLKESGEKEIKHKELVQKGVTYPPVMDELIAEKNQLDHEIQQLDTEPENKERFIDRKSQLIKEIDNFKKILMQKEVNEKQEDRIKELLGLQKHIAQRIADIEKQEYLSEEFIKTKVELLESKINEKFNNVSFRLFESQVNGGLKEACEVIIDGVPFKDANNAAQVNGGIDVINTLTNHFDVSAPIFIDNRESITDIIHTESQVINLIVSDEHKILKVA